MALRALQGPTGGGAPVGGTGTTNTIPRWTGPSTLGDSGITDNGSTVSFVGRNLASTAAQTWTLASGASALNIASNLLAVDTTNNAIRIGSNTTRNRLTLVSATTDAVPTLGTASGALFLGSNSANYGLISGVDASGNAWFQAQRVDGAAAAYNLLLQPSGGNVGIGTASPLARLHSAGGNTGYSFACSGTTRAFRVEHNTTETRIVGVDNTLNASFQPLAIGGSEVLFMFSGVTAWKVNTSGHLLAGSDNSYDIGASGATRPRIVYVGTGVVGGYIRAGAASAGVASTTTIGNGTSTTATAGAQTLPANPLGFIIAHVGTTEVRIPYYAV